MRSRNVSCGSSRTRSAGVSFIGVISLYLFAGLAGFLYDEKGVVLFDDPFDVEVLVAAYDDEPEAFVHHTLVVAR